jgi:hypothetical protein
MIGIPLQAQSTPPCTGLDSDGGYEPEIRNKMDSAAGTQEATGEKFSVEAMKYAQSQSWLAVERIREGMRPGMTQQQGTEFATAVLEKMGMDRNWHMVVVRFGAETLKTFYDETDHSCVLGEEDIFYIDIGPVWRGHEGDVGDTFTLGSDPEMQACTKAARELWHDVSDYWRKEKASGQNLYACAVDRAQAMGWRLNLGARGHRVSDFPHAIYKAGKLGDFSLCPSVGLWILEIQIAHPSRPFGAFFEDLLVQE